MKNKATHQGTCQICGSTQKLPSNLLSIHGYTVQWGFFSGVCSGSKNLPFEKSIALIEGAIANAQRMLDETRKESAELKAGKQFANNEAWRNVYHASKSRFVPSGYFWELVAVEEKQHRNDDGDYTFTTFSARSANDTRPAGFRDRVDTYELDARYPTLDQVRTMMNIQYAKQHLDKRASNLAGYIKWQRERIANWKPSELKPIEGK